MAKDTQQIREKYVTYQAPCTDGLLLWAIIIIALIMNIF